MFHTPEVYLCFRIAVQHLLQPSACENYHYHLELCHWTSVDHQTQTIKSFICISSTTSSARAQWRHQIALFTNNRLSHRLCAAVTVTSNTSAFSDVCQIAFYVDFILFCWTREREFYYCDWVISYSSLPFARSVVDWSLFVDNNLSFDIFVCSSICLFSHLIFRLLQYSPFVRVAWVCCCCFLFLFCPIENVMWGSDTQRNCKSLLFLSVFVPFFFLSIQVISVRVLFIFMRKTVKVKYSEEIHQTRATFSP